MSRFSLYRGVEHCPICSSYDGRCKTKDSLILCMSLTDAVAVAGYRHVGRTKCSTWGEWIPDSAATGGDDWQRRLEDRRRRNEQAERAKWARSMAPQKRDRLYREILSNLALSAEDRADLARRGLTSAQIDAGGFRSVESWQPLTRAYPRNLPGIAKDGRSLIAAEAGYLCPVRDRAGHIVALQLRVRGATDNKYRWVSSNSSQQLPSGESPLAHFDAGNRPWVVFCEGTGPKPYLASIRLGCRVIGAAGGQFASSPDQVRDVLGENITPILAPDAGAIHNPNVMRHYRGLAQLVPGLQVLWWGQSEKSAGDVDEVPSARLQNAKLLRWNEFLAIAGDASPRTSPLEQESWKSQYSAAARRSWEKIKRFTPTHTVDQRFLSIDVAELAAYDVHAVRSDMGTGKTQELARLLSLIDRGAIALGCRNSLLLQQVERFGGFYHLHNDAAFGLTADPNSRIAACIDSLIHFADEHFDGKILILDEDASVIKHALLSSTLKDKRQRCLDKLEQAVKRASVVICWDGNNADIAVNYVTQLRGSDCRVLQKLNQYRSDALNVEIVRAVGTDPDKPLLRDYSPVVRKVDEAMSLTQQLGSGAIAIISDSQRHCEALAARYEVQGFDVLRVDSKTVTDEHIKEFLKAPDSYLQQHQPDLLIMSPTAESGIDISIKGYFRKGFAFFFGVIDTDTQLQFLRRVRDLLDWCIWCQEYTTLEDWEGTRSPFARSLLKDLLEALQMDAEKALSGSPDHTHLQALLENLKAQANNPHTQTALQFIAARNYERSHTRECLQHLLEQRGHQVTLVNLERDLKAGEELAQEKEAIEIAYSNAVYRAKDITASEAFSIRASFSATEEDRQAADKALLKAKLPGIDLTSNWTPNFIRLVLFQDRGLIARQERFWMLNHMDAAQERARQHWRRLSESGAFPTDLKTDYLFLRALNSFNLLALLDGEHTADSELIQTIYNRCKRSKKLQTALGRSPGKLAPLDFVGRLAAAVGIESKAAMTPRDEQGDRQRVYTYSSPADTDAGRTILDCLDRRFQKYLNPEAAETFEESTLDLDHLPPSKDTEIGLGDPAVGLLASEFESDRSNITKWPAELAAVWPEFESDWHQFPESRPWLIEAARSLEATA